jgi:hypothetical protein
MALPPDPVPRQLRRRLAPGFPYLELNISGNASFAPSGEARLPHEPRLLPPPLSQFSGRAAGTAGAPSVRPACRGSRRPVRRARRGYAIGFILAGGTAPLTPRTAHGPRPTHRPRTARAPRDLHPMHRPGTCVPHTPHAPHAAPVPCKRPQAARASAAAMTHALPPAHMPEPLSGASECPYGAYYATAEGNLPAAVGVEPEPGQLPLTVLRVVSQYAPRGFARRSARQAHNEVVVLSHYLILCAG